MNPAKNADEPTVLQGFGTALKNNLVSIAVAAVAAVGIIFAVPAAGSEEMPEVRLGTAAGPSQAGLPRGLNPTGSSGAGDPWREVNRSTNKKTGKLATWEDRNGGVSNDGTVPIDKAKKQWGPGIVGVLKTVSDAKALDALFNSLGNGGKTLNPGRYPGVVKELPDGTIIRMRPRSQSGGAAIDITVPDGGTIKVHIK